MKILFFGLLVVVNSMHSNPPLGLVTPPSVVSVFVTPRAPQKNLVTPYYIQRQSNKMLQPKSLVLQLRLLPLKTQEAVLSLLALSQAPLK
jgi:hypothetical protein